MVGKIALMCVHSPSDVLDLALKGVMGDHDSLENIIFYKVFGVNINSINSIVNIVK